MNLNNNELCNNNNVPHHFNSLIKFLLYTKIFSDQSDYNHVYWSNEECSGHEDEEELYDMAKDIIEKVHKQYAMFICRETKINIQFRLCTIFLWVLKVIFAITIS